MDVISALQFLRLNEIPEDWVNLAWDTEFTERKPLNDVLEKELDGSEDEAFRTLYHCFLAYVPDQQQSTSINGSSQNFWGIFRENGVSIKALVAVLSFYVLGAKARAANTQNRVGGLYAASLYLLLLKIPGSIANQVFHEVLLDTCSDLTSHCWPQDSGKKRKKDGMKNPQGEGKRAKAQKKKPPQMEMDEAEEQDEEEEDIYFSNEDLMKIREAAVFLVHSLLRLLQTFPLKDRPETASSFTQIFCKLLHIEPVLGEITFAAPRDMTEMRSIPEMAFYGLELLCLAKHGDQKESLRSVFHQLLYAILMMNKESRGKPVLRVLSRSVLAIRDYAIQFVSHLVEEQRELAKPFLEILLQHICFQMVEKSEYRSHGAQAVGMLTSQMENADYSRFIKWLFNFSRQPKMVHRLFSVDVVMALLEQTERRLEESQDPELAIFLPQRFLIQDLLFARRMDDSPTVQGHALSCLAQCLELPSLNVTRAVHNLFSGTGTQTVLDSELAGVPSCTQSSMKSLPFRTVEISCVDGSGSEAAKANLALLLRRVKDSKTNVRKAALQALLGLLKHGVIPPTWENLETLSERTRDPAVSVRKKALQCVGELLSAKAECSTVQKAWLQGVLPAVVDSESSVQEKALDALEQVLLSQVKLYNGGHHMDTDQRLTWDLLGLLSHECRNLSRYFSRAFTIWSKQNKFTPAFITNLMSHFKADHAAGAWLLLSKVATSCPKVPCGKILDSWDASIRSRDVDVTTFCHILSVMGDVAVHLNDDTKNRIVEDLMSLLKSFTLSLELISTAVQTLYQLGCQENIKETQAFLNQHCGELVSICEAYLSAVILNENGAQDLDEELMIKHLHTLGVASLQCPAKVSKKTVLVVESVLTAHSNKLTDCQDDLPASLPLSQFKVNALPPRIKAHGVLTLGKLCLQQEELVHKYLPVFARELEVGKEVAVRNNIVVVMCDLCVRYTNIVDHYIPNISACLRDDEDVIREQTLIMLTNLLQEEFVKWKGSLFFRFMASLVDPVPSVASLCEYCLVHLLLKKNPEMFSQHFIECIFHFNSYHKHKSYNKFPQSEREKVRFSLKGAQHHEKRFRIYRFLLEHFTDAQRFNTTNKINQTVLASFADEDLPLDADGAEILSETFKILSLKEMKLQAVTAGGTAGEEIEEENMAKAVLQAAQKKVLSQVQKKAFIENTIPLVISLKNLLEQRRSPVLKDLMAYLQVMMQEYRNEVKEFFSGDEQLAAEVEFALKTAEKEKKMQEQMENCTLSEGAEAQTAQGSVHSSPIKQSRILTFNFTTPQPPRPHPQMPRRPMTDLRVSRSRPGEHSSSKSIALERTGRLSEALKDRAFSTPKGTNVQITFNEGLSAIYSEQGSTLNGEASVLHMRPNEQNDAGPTLWNVQSPLRQKKRASKM